MNFIYQFWESLCYAEAQQLFGGDEYSCSKSLKFKNNLRIFLGSKSKDFKNIEAQRKIKSILLKKYAYVCGCGIKKSIDGIGQRPHYYRQGAILTDKP